MDFTGAATPLADPDVLSEAAGLGCEAAAVWAVCDVESSGSGFLPDSRPRILFEAHVFGKLTRHRYDASHRNISSPTWNRALYGPGGAHQYDRLAAALLLDGTAALEATSWGMFQILGANFGACGHASVEEFINAVRRSERDQLLAFGEFCRRIGLDRPLQALDWTRFALGYNGPAEAENDYDEKLEAAYLRRVGRAGSAVRDLGPGPNQNVQAAASGPTRERGQSSEMIAESLNQNELAQLR